MLQGRILFAQAVLFLPIISAYDKALMVLLVGAQALIRPLQKEPLVLHSCSAC